MDRNTFKIKLPYKIGDKIAFVVPNSPVRHGKIIKFLIENEDYIVKVIGCIVKCKNSSKRVVYFDEFIEEDYYDL